MMDTSVFPPTTTTNRKIESPDLRSTETAPRIVIVHPDDTYRAALLAYLQADGFVIEEFDDAKSAFECIVGDTPVDTILIDVDPPQTAGIELFFRLKTLGVRTPMALFARDADQAQEDRALEQGAAEYFSKSRRFSIIARRLRLLVDGARAKTTLAGPTADVISIGPLDVRLRSHRASWHGNEVPLTVTEFKIVRLLACQMGEQISYREIYDMVHGSGFFAGEGPQGYRINVRSLIRKIRDRFRAIDEDFIEIENCAGYGYRWRGPERDNLGSNMAEYMLWHSSKARTASAKDVLRSMSEASDSLRTTHADPADTKLSAER